MLRSQRYRVMAKLQIGQAIVVEGRDDVRAVQEACDALIIPTHGYGISKETWEMIDKAYSEKGIIILTDPDYAGENIRRKLSDKYPDAVHAYVDRKDATDGSDIGVENARPDEIRAALEKALENAGRTKPSGDKAKRSYAEMQDMVDLGLAAGEGSAERRAAVCKGLGIGYGNAAQMIKKLKGFDIDIDELKEEVSKHQ